MPTVTYDIGYAGVVKLKSNQVLATGGNMSVEHTPIYTSGVWGAGYRNATDKIAFAPNYVTLTSSVNFQLTSNITSTISSWAFSDRATEGAYCILPNGVAGYSGSALCTGCSFSTSQDSLVTGDFSLKSGKVSGTLSTSSVTNSGTGAGNLGSIAPNYLDVYPFWATAVYFQDQSDTSRVSPASTAGNLVQDVTDWNASYTSDVTFVMTCCGTSDSLGTSGGVLQAKYAALGIMQASGSFTMFKISSYLAPNQIRKIRNAYITMSTASGGSTCKIKFGSIVLDSASTDVQTGTSLIQTSFNFTALGNGSTSPMDFSAS